MVGRACTTLMFQRKSAVLWEKLPSEHARWSVVSEESELLKTHWRADGGFYAHMHTEVLARFGTATSQSALQQLSECI